MSYSIIVDPHRKMAVLVCDEPLFGLGPAIAADEPEEAVEALEAFCDALEAPADELPTIRLMIEWSAFIQVISGAVVTMAGDAREPASPDGAAGDGDSVDAIDAALQAADTDRGALAAGDPAAHRALAAAAAGGPFPPDEDEEDEDNELAGTVDPDVLADRLAHVPGGTPAQRGEQECWACGGTGAQSAVPGEPECGVCHGQGRIPVTA